MFVVRFSLLALLLAAPASADPPHILIGQDLRERRIELGAIVERSITFADELGLARTEPTAQQLAVVRVAPRARFDAATLPGWYERLLRLEVAPDDPAPPGLPEALAGTGVLALTDGQRLPGRLSPATPPEGRIRWEHALFGTIDADLDRILGVSFDGTWTGETAGVHDTIVLINGDRLTGYVERIGPELVVESNGARTTIPVSRAASVHLVNPTVRPEGQMVWLSDGSVLAVSSVQVSLTGRVELQSPDVGGSAGAMATVSASRVTAIAFDAAALVQLASIVPEQESLAGRRWTPLLDRTTDAPLGAGDIAFPGPMTTRWPLPRGAVRFATTAELPPASWVWGDCEIVASVSAPGMPPRELARIRVNGDRPKARLEATLPEPARPDRTLIITVEPGEHGPIQDRPVLRRALLLIDPSR